MELQWDDDPVPDGPFFTRDLYDKYSLSPHIRELWTFLQSPAENSDIKQRCEEAAADHSIPPLKDAAQVKESSCFDSQASGGESCYTDDPSAGNDAEETKNSKRSKNSKGKTNKEVDVAYPEPRLPYPCMSSLTCKDQKTYLGYLMSKKTRGPPRNLTMRINNEVMQFMMYLQDVAKICAEDYNFITQGAMQYTEEFFQACLESVKALPQFYQIHEMTSLTGGTFNPGLALTFEKQLLAMGTVSLTDHKMVPADAQLASDYPSVSSANPPAKKAKDKHAMISRDGNAEKLCSYYEPHVCLTRDALLRLLDNHGPDFGDHWELPVMVKATAGKGSNKRKTLYVDSPLLKQEVTIRERSQIYHEESLKLSILTNGSKKIFHLMTERPADEHQLSQETSVRGSMSVENNGLDFEVDLTDLETFGEITIKAPIKEKKRQQDEGVQSNKPTSTPDRTKSNISSNCLTASCSSQEEINTVSKTTENLRTETSHQSVSEAEMPKTKSTGSQQILDDQPEFMADSDDEKLIIDDSGSVLASPTNQLKPLNIESSTDPLITSPVKPTLEMIGYSPPSKRTRSKRTTIQAKAPGDQLGEILRMQTAMFKSGNESTTPIKSPSRCVEPQLNTHQTSLVKPCVSSYLKRQQNEDGEFPIVPSESASANIIPTEHKKILSENLQSCAEDEQDYEAPVEGNLLYKLYSLQDLLVMVRSSVSLTHSRNVANIQNQFVPVHVLPKLEYQLSYGVEYLTSSEACQLWTETALHSSTVSYIAHINAHTSKVALLRKLPDDWMQNISCGFKPSKSLNILHHLLKKLTGLDEGQYLVVHKAREPFVTLLKATGQKGNQGAYNLQQAHSSVPQPPSLCYLPWIPVDPAVVLPFHQQHGRVPCTFPPKTFQKTDGVNNDNRAGQKKNPNAQKKGKKKKPSGKYKRYNKKQVQKSV